MDLLAPTPERLATIWQKASFFVRTCTVSAAGSKSSDQQPIQSRQAGPTGSKRPEATTGNSLVGSVCNFAAKTTTIAR